MDERDDRSDAPPPAMTPDSRFSSLKRILVGTVLGAVLFWRGGDAAVRGLGEMVRKAPVAKRAFALSEDQRIQEALRRFESDYGYQPGELGKLYEVFATKVEFPDEVLVIMDRFDLRRAGITRLAYHLYPLRLGNMPALPPDGPPDPAVIDEHSWVLEIDPGPPSKLTPWFEEVARGPSFALWRGRTRGG